MKFFKLLLIPVLSLILITPAYASFGLTTINECQFDSLKPIHARLTVALFGNTGAAAVASESERKAVSSASSEILTECAKPLPNLADSFSFGLLAALAIVTSVGFAFFFISNNARAIFSGLFNSDKLGSSIGRVVLFVVGSALVLPFSSVFSYLMSGKGERGLMDVDNIMSPIQILSIKAFGESLTSIQKISDDIVSVDSISASQYRVPDAQYVARQTGYNLNSYNYNNMTHFIDFARCTTEKHGRQPIEVTLSDLRVNVLDDRVVAEVGTIESGCHLKFSTPFDSSPSDSIKESMKEFDSGAETLLQYASAYEKSQKDVVETLTRDLLRMALNYQYGFYNTVIASNRNDFLYTAWKIEPNSDWRSVCPAEDGDLSTLFNIDKPSRWAAGQIIEIQRQAELCMSDIVVQKLSYPKDFSVKTGSARLHKTCGSDDLDTCLTKVCSIDATANRTGLFECAAAIDSKLELMRLSRFTDLGFMAMPVVLMQKSETRGAPIDPQKVLSDIKVETLSNLTMRGEHDVNYKEINRNYLAAADASYAGVAEYIPKRTGSESADDRDIFGMTPFIRCLGEPNTVVLDDSGDLKYRCGSVISEISAFGSRVRSIGIYYYLGRALDGAASKIMRDKMSSNNDGGIDSGSKPKEKSQSNGFLKILIKYGTPIFGAALSGFIDNIMTSGVDAESSPYSIDSGNSWLGSMTNSSAFLVGYVMGGDVAWYASPALYLIGSGIILEFGLPYAWIILAFLGFMTGFAKFIYNLTVFGMYLIFALARNEREMFPQLKKSIAELISSILYLVFFIVGFYLAYFAVDQFMSFTVPMLSVVASAAVPDSLSTAPLIEAMVYVALLVVMLIVIFSMCIKLVFKLTDYSQEVMFESTEKRDSRMASNSHSNLKQKANIGKSYI
ncbi:TPA: hypothetical protein I7229_20880 [Vibrio vulnificus]|nr:hypothetical protein [Vibrio vulnificus]HDY7571819.1 hypothetical protein [Vibrio vulnificus]